MEPGPDAPAGGGGGGGTSTSEPAEAGPSPSSSSAAAAASSSSRQQAEQDAQQQQGAQHQEAPAPQPLAQQPPAGLSRYESQKRRDWNTFLQYLRNHKPPLTLARCSGAHVIEFLRYLDQFGKTKVHAEGCAYFGQPYPPAPCTCPLRQAWGSLDALIGRLRAAYEESGGRPESNPFAAKAVRIYLRDVREAQAKARGIPYEKRKRKRGSAAAPPVAPPPVVTAGTTSGTGGEEEEEEEEEEPSPSAGEPQKQTTTPTSASTPSPTQGMKSRSKTAGFAEISRSRYSPRCGFRSGKHCISVSNSKTIKVKLWSKNEIRNSKNEIVIPPTTSTSRAPASSSSAVAATTSTTTRKEEEGSAPSS